MHVCMYAYIHTIHVAMHFCSGSQRFMNTCDVTEYADDITVGAIIGEWIGILVIKQFIMSCT